MKIARIVQQAQETNTRNEQALLSRFLRAEHFTLLKPKVQSLSNPEHFRSDLHGARGERPGSELRLHNRRQRVRPLNGDWEEFDREMEHQGRAEVMTDAGESVLLVLSTDSAGKRWIEEGHRYYARSEDGRLLIIETHLRPISRHHITVAGNCDRMPTSSIPSGWSVIVLEDLGATDFEKLKRVELTFEGESISTGCESYTD